VQLWSDGFYATPGLSWDRETMQGRPFYYFAYGAAVSEVIVDTLTGEWKLLRADVLHDAGHLAEPGTRHRPGRRRLHPGHGLADDGRAGLAPADRHALPPTRPAPTRSPPPTTARPIFNVHLYDRPNVQDSIHRSKAVGEPPLLLPFSVFFAIRDAVSAVGGHRVDPPLQAPATSEAILRAVHGRAAGPAANDMTLRPARHRAGLVAGRPAGGRRRGGGARGSVPREAGTRMLVAPTEVHGTIGGGHLELKAIASGTAAARRRRPGARTALPARAGAGPVLRRRGDAALVAAGGRPTRRLARCRCRASRCSCTAPAMWAARSCALLAGMPCRVQWIDERESEFPAGPLPPHIDTPLRRAGGGRGGAWRRPVPSTWC
jgi:hypothetical protein